MLTFLISRFRVTHTTNQLPASHHNYPISNNSIIFFVFSPDISDFCQLLCPSNEKATIIRVVASVRINVQLRINCHLVLHVSTLACYGAVFEVIRANSTLLEHAKCGLFGDGLQCMGLDGQLYCSDSTVLSFPTRFS